MKEFKNWWNKKHTFEELKKVISDPKTSNPADVLAELTWRAALEAVQNVTCKDGILQDDFVIREWVRKELYED